MKNRLCFVFLALTIFTGLKAQHYSQIEYENLTTISSDNWFRPQMTVYGNSIREGKKFGTYFFSLLNPGWGQVYGGLLYKPASWITLNAGAGLETDSMPLRLNAGAFIAVNRLTLLQIYEYGGSGFWYNIILNYALSSNFKSGFIFKRYYGLGINMEYMLPKTSLTINLAPLYDFEFASTRLMLLLRYAL